MPWERLAAWLLRRRGASDLPPGEQRAIELMKELDSRWLNFQELAAHARPQQFRLEERLIPGLFNDPLDPAALTERIRDMKQDHPGVVAIAHYLMQFDPTYIGNAGSLKHAGDSEAWNDRRAWQLGQLVTHPALHDDPLYEPIRVALRNVGYIDQDGNARDFPTRRAVALGDFDLPLPITDDPHENR